jgi:hypothetical protein
MPARTRAARASLRARRLILKNAFSELYRANDAVLAAAASISAAMHAEMIDGPAAYELLRALHLRLVNAIEAAEIAARQAATSGEGTA